MHYLCGATGPTTPGAPATMSRKVRFEDCKKCPKLARQKDSGRALCTYRNITLHEMYYDSTEADCPLDFPPADLGDPMDPTPIASLRTALILSPSSAYTAELHTRLTLDQAEKAKNIVQYITRVLSDIYHGRECYVDCDEYEICREMLATAACELQSAIHRIEDAMRDNHSRQLYYV